MSVPASGSFHRKAPALVRFCRRPLSRSVTGTLPLASSATERGLFEPRPSPKPYEPIFPRCVGGAGSVPPGFRVSVVDFVTPPYPADTVIGVAARTDFVTMLNVAELAPGGTTTAGGRTPRSGWLLVNATVRPPAGAPPFRFTRLARVITPPGTDAESPTPGSRGRDGEVRRFRDPAVGRGDDRSHRRGHRFGGDGEEIGDGAAGGT